jgi:ubiquinone/menaquinone biosynthesis C-methylase UbiE
MTNEPAIPDERKLRKLARRSGDPWVPANEFFRVAEGPMDDLWNDLIFPFIRHCDFSAVVDLAAGQGRNTRILASKAERVLVLDIQAGNVEICRRRFAENSNVECSVNNGYDLRPAEDGAFTLVYCFDAMVHFEKEVVRSYLRDTARVLKPGGRGFFHHSNYTGGHDWQKNPHSRNFMSRELFASYAQAEGLRVVGQQVFDWGHVPDLDCLSLVEKP